MLIFAIQFLIIRRNLVCSWSITLENIIKNDVSYLIIIYELIGINMGHV